VPVGALQARVGQPLTDRILLGLGPRHLARLPVRLPRPGLVSCLPSDGLDGKGASSGSRGVLELRGGGPGA
jgi:hypothetical protein